MIGYVQNQQEITNIRNTYTKKSKKGRQKMNRLTKK